MDGIAISICPSRYPRFELLRCLDLADLPMATGRASASPESALGAGASLSPRVPVLRLNFMSKCYLIGCRLQQRVVDRVMHRSCHIHHPMRRTANMCSVHICFQRLGG